MTHISRAAFLAAAPVLAIALAVLVLAPARKALAQDSGDANTPIIELVTMGPGELLWEKWGHAALCVRYPDPRRDVCYNYGTTDFANPVTLVWDFLRGRSLFWVSRTTPQRMIHFYSNVLDRTMWVQTLPLSPDKARETAEVLKTASREENKYYKYHHYEDNCSTRVRDIVDTALGGVLSAGEERYPYSFREITRRGLSEYPVLVILSDFGIGRPADRIATIYQAMHLPDVLRDEVKRHAGIEPVVIYERRGRDFDVSHPASRLWLFAVALLLAVPAVASHLTGRYRRLGLAIAIVPPALIGTLLWSMAIISTLPEIRYNEVILVLWPTDLALPFLSPTRRRQYARVRVVALMLVSILSVLGVLHQPLWTVIVLPLIPCLVAALMTPAAEEPSPSPRAEPAKGKQKPKRR